MEANEKFAAWAKSYSGYEGGKLAKGKGIWICGLEPKGKKDEKLEELKPVPEFPSCNAFHNIKKVCSDASNGKPSKFWKDIKEKFLHKIGMQDDELNDRLALLNLYPIYFPQMETNTGEWVEKGYRDITGLKNKKDYIEWCKENRFQQFRKLKEEHKPKVIIGMGKPHDNQLQAFFGKGQYAEKKEFKNIKKNGKRNEYLYIEADGCLFIGMNFPRHVTTKDWEEVVEMVKEWLAK